MHVIRLRGPWEYQWLAGDTVALASAQEESDATSPTGGIVHLPIDWRNWLEGRESGLIRLGRRFARPSGLQPRNHVYLVLANPAPGLVAKLNGELLTAVESEIRTEGRPLNRWDVTTRLLARNLLQIDSSWPPPVSEPWGNVALEIEE